MKECDDVDTKAEFKLVPIENPDERNLILGQSHFIKTVEDLHEALVTAIPGLQFGLAFCEASGPCLIRSDGNDADLTRAAVAMMSDVGAGHSFAIVMGDGFPVNVLNAVKDCQEVCRVYCATANPIEVVVAETAQGKGILGVVDGSSPSGVETEEDVESRRGFLRTIGYKR